MMGATSTGHWRGLIAVELPKVKRIPYRRYPVALRRSILERIKFLEACLAYENLETDWLEILNEYRSNRVGGITNPRYIIKMNQDHPGLLELVAALDEAFFNLHNYRPEDHLSEGIYRLVQGKNANKVRPNAQTRAPLLKKVGAWLAKKGYKDSDDKAGMIRDAMGKFDCKKTDATDAARLANLTRPHIKSPR